METKIVGIDHLLGKACALSQRMRKSGLNAGTSGDIRLVAALIVYVNLKEEGVLIDKITYSPFSGDYEFHQVPARFTTPSGVWPIQLQEP